jgi:hypothetical protein
MKTYKELQDAVKFWLNREDLSDKDDQNLNRPMIGDMGIIKTFIALAERKIFRGLRCPANEVTAITTFINDNTDNTSKYVNEVKVPPDLLTIKSLTINNRGLDFMDYSVFVRQFPGYPLDSHRMCAKFSREGDKLILPYNLEIKKENGITTYPQVKINYWADFSGMNDPDETNSVLRIAPDLYLFGSLMEAEAYLVNDPRVQMWQQKYVDAYIALTDYSHQIDYNAGPLIIA